MVREEWLCAGRVPPESFGTRGTDPPDVWFSVAAVGGKEAHDAVRAVAFGLGCSGSGATGGTNAVARDRIDGQRGARPHSASLVQAGMAVPRTRHYGTMMWDSSRLSSGDWGNWPRRNSMKRRERGRPLVRSRPMR